MPTSKRVSFYPTLLSYIEGLRQEASLISPERKEQLLELAEYIQSKPGSNLPVALNFICTHNSRRSHIAQIWSATAAAYFGLDYIETFSGGTEATALDHRAAAALERAGFQIENPGGNNPRYRVAYSPREPPLECFSKTFDHPANPRQDFAAIMTCSDADENCPLIPGAEWRLALTYEDPKEADGSPTESSRYNERVRQIGREIFYALSQV